MISLLLCSVVTERESLAKHIMHHHYLTLVRQQRAWEPLDLPVIHRDNTHPSKHASSPTWQDGALCQYWKLIASIPQGSHDNRSPCNWLKAKLRRGKISKELRRSRLRDNENVSCTSVYCFFLIRFRLFQHIHAQPQKQNPLIKIFTK